MKKIVLFVCFSLALISLKAVETSDYISLSPLTLDPGGEENYFIVSLNGSENFYSGYNMDIQLPAGIDVVYEDGKPSVYMVDADIDPETIYPYTTNKLTKVKTYTHTVSCSYGVVGDGILRVACISTSNEALTKASGSLFAVFVKASAYAKPGTADITIDGVALKVAGGAEYVPESRVDQNVSVSTSATTKLSVSVTNKWSTCILPFDLDVPEGVTAYTCNSTTTIDEASFLVLNKANTFEAYKPYIVYSETGFDNSVEGTVDGSKYPEKGYVTEGYLNGAIKPQTINAGHVLQNLNGTVQFYNTANKEFVIPAGKCWATIPSTNPAQAIGFKIGDERTMIDHMVVEEDNVLYDLSGRRITHDALQGILIKNGKKVFMNK